MSIEYCQRHHIIIEVNFEKLVTFIRLDLKLTLHSDL